VATGSWLVVDFALQNFLPLARFSADIHFTLQHHGI
jgi:hypothetical protein